MYKEIVKQSIGKGSEEVMHKSVELVDELLMEIKGKFLLSSYPSDVLEEFTHKHNWRSKKIEMTKSAGGKGTKKVEVLTYNYDTSKERQQCLFD